MNRSFKDYLLLSLKGMAMGAADVVPGVSGGTIAFITGIYEEFIHSLKSINISALIALKEGGISKLWKHVNGNFLVALFLGIGISIVSLAKVITYLLDTYPVIVWSFFFGLILASVFFVGKSIKKWGTSTVIAFAVGTIIAYLITTLPPSSGNEELWFVFVSGLIAICAMILPGISGSFILVLLGSYQFILGSLKEFELMIILVFAAGCVTGLISFSKLLNWLFTKFHDITIAVLSGFLLGSLNKIWPWKNTLEFVQVQHSNRPDTFVPVVQEIPFLRAEDR